MTVQAGGPFFRAPWGASPRFGGLVQARCRRGRRRCLAPPAQARQALRLRLHLRRHNCRLHEQQFPLFQAPPALQFRQSLQIVAGGTACCGHSLSGGHHLTSPWEGQRWEVGGASTGRAKLPPLSFSSSVARCRSLSPSTEGDCKRAVDVVGAVVGRADGRCTKYLRIDCLSNQQRRSCRCRGTVHAQGKFPWHAAAFA